MKIYILTMLTLEERINILELLSGLDQDDLMSLASTVTRGLLKPTTREGRFITNQDFKLLDSTKYIEQFKVLKEKVTSYQFLLFFHGWLCKNDMEYNFLVSCWLAVSIFAFS
jgi:hypothetical protein